MNCAWLTLKLIVIFIYSRWNLQRDFLWQIGVGILKLHSKESKVCLYTILHTYMITNCYFWKHDLQPSILFIILHRIGLGWSTKRVVWVDLCCPLWCKKRDIHWILGMSPSSCTPQSSTSNPLQAQTLRVCWSLGGQMLVRVRPRRVISATGESSVHSLLPCSADWSACALQGRCHRCVENLTILIDINCACCSTLSRTTQTSISPRSSTS